MRTSFDLPDGLLQQAKSVARERGVPVRDLVILGLTHVLSARPAPYRLPDLAFEGDGLVDGLEPCDWDEITRRAYEGRGA
jgi:hypothetical protein